MARTGRPRAWTAEQREQVLTLAEEGLAQRAIAHHVFGEPRYRGRVERILRDHALAPPPSDPQTPTQAELEDFDASSVSIARELVARYERALAESEEVPSLADIERLLRIKRQLAAAESVERARQFAPSSTASPL